MNIQVIDYAYPHPDFAALTALLDEELIEAYGADVMQAYHPHNMPEGILHTVVVYCDGKPSACGGIKRFDDFSVEIKRIFVRPSRRALGLGGRVIRRLMELAAADGYQRAVLETAADMTAALALYQKHGFTQIKNYGPYAGDALCICMEKRLP